MENILKSFVDVAPFINSLTNADFAVSVCDLEKCLAYISSDKQDHGIKAGDMHISGSVSYESIMSGKRTVKRVGPEVFGFPYIAIAIPIEEEGKVVGSVTFTEAVDTQDILLALADNLHDTMQQLLSITDTISANSKKLKEVAENLNKVRSDSDNGIKEDLDKLLNISSDQININNYIANLVKDINERTEKLKENARLLSE